MSSPWTQELSIQLVHLVHGHECLWNPEVTATAHQKNAAWEVITEELKQYNPDLVSFDVKERFYVLKTLYHRLMKKHRSSEERPRSWIYKILQFLPSSKEFERTFTFTAKETQRIIELLEANECLWLKKYIPKDRKHNKTKTRYLALGEMHRELSKSNPRMTFRLLQRKVTQIKYEFYRFERLKGRSKFKQKPPLWHSKLSFLKRNLIPKDDKQQNADPEETEEYILEEILSEEETFFGNTDAVEGIESIETTFDALESPPFTINSCRICLENKGIFNICDQLNAVAPSYIDCCQRFFQLTFDAADEKFPQKICPDCANTLKDTYELAEKAMKSNNILNTYKSPKLNAESSNFDEETVESTFNDTNDFEMYSEIDIKAEDIDICSNSLVELSEDIAGLTKSEEYEADVAVSLECNKLSDNEDEDEEQDDIHSLENNSDSNEEPADANFDKTQEKKKRKPQKFLMCHICSKTLRGKTALRLHVDRHDKSRQRNYECDVCGFKMFSRSEFNGHKKIHQPERKRQYQCEFCDKAYYTSGSLTVHRRSHTGTTFPCSMCSKSFCTKLELQIHLNIHIGNKTYECEICGEKFFRNSAYNAHKNKFHKGVKYKCDYCSRVFINGETFKNHLYSHTGYPYECDLCGKGRPTKYKCRVHIMQVHKIEDIDEAYSHVKLINTNKMRMELKRYYADSKGSSDKSID